MEIENIKEQFEKKIFHKNKVHKILAYSYLFYFVSFMIGLIFDFFSPIKVLGNSVVIVIGILFLLFGTFLIIWAQKVSSKIEKENISKETFCNGPYRYTRSPTHFGLFLLIFGFGMIINNLFIIIFSVIAFFFTKFIFIKKEEEILSQKYGAPYLEYKKMVKF